ncbi:diguanylate cyclase [Desulfovibrio sp. OttesenSCG-928-A18]|nr:diguanylate cyclase [Desulfovibrio sp. OttesenSCG-928-A18]
MPEDIQQELALTAVRYLVQLVNAPTVPDIPPELERFPDLASLRDTVVALREHLVRLSKGDLSQDLTTRGFMAGLLKSHLANMRHLTWQVEQVSQGDFTQRVDFMGEFSKAFNNMVVQLDTTLSNLRTTEEALTELTVSLRHQVDLRNSAMEALRESEARFKYLAEHDPLTGVLNRRSFLLLAETGMKKAAHRDRPCCLALLDVDHFKRLNDTYGHLEGDTALKHLVALATRNLRKSDSMGRYGGEEFIFFFADADIEQGWRAAERIRAALAGTPVPLKAGPVYITASLGLCVIMPEWGAESRGAPFLQKVISMADAALYRAKQEGRNRICTAPVSNPALLVTEGIGRNTDAPVQGVAPIESPTTGPDPAKGV